METYMKIPYKIQCTEIHKKIKILKMELYRNMQSDLESFKK